MSICDCCAEESDGCIIEPVHGATLCPTCVDELTTGAALIAAERDRQIAVEGWTAELDDEQDLCELAQAAKTYVSAAQIAARGESPSTMRLDGTNTYWPWSPSWWKPSDDPIRNLVKAGAMIAAEIDRLLRSAG